MYAKLAAAVLATAIVISPAAAEERTRRDSGDPNRLVCQNVRETGSRLVRRRICMTASQWAEERRDMRQRIERLQSQNPQRAE